MSLSEQSNYRILTVYRKYFGRAFNRFILLPEIRLAGKWLEKIGFKSEKKIAVLYKEDRIVIINTERSVVIL